MRNLVLILSLFLLGFVSTFANAQEQNERRLSSSSQNLRSTPISNELVLRNFQQAYRNRSLPLTSINLSEDCSAETTCPNGIKLECSIAGPATSCHSDANGVGCFKSNDDGSVDGSAGQC